MDWTGDPFGPSSVYPCMTCCTVPWNPLVFEIFVFLPDCLKLFSICVFFFKFHFIFNIRV